MDRSSPARTLVGAAALLAGALSLAGPWTGSRAQDSADVEIRLVKGDAIRISKIDDWVPAVRDATGTIGVISGRYDGQCVYTTTGLYRLRLESANGTGNEPLVVVKPPGTRPQDRMRYYLAIVSDRSGVGYVRQDYGTSEMSVGNELVGSTDPDCIGGRNNNGFNLYIGAYVLGPDFNLAEPGVYRDTVTITVSSV